MTKLARRGSNVRVIREVYAARLFARPRPLFGFARTFDIAGLFNSYNVSNSAAEADRLAIRSDWLAVGSDLRRVLIHYRKNPHLLPKPRRQPRRVAHA